MRIKDKYISPCLKVYRDLKNVIDTAYDEGEAKGELKKAKEIAQIMLLKGLDIKLISEITKLSQQEIEQLNK